VVHPKKITQHNNCRRGDRIILTKPLGVGLVTSAYRVGEASRESFDAAVNSMVTLNKYAFEIAKKYDISSVTDVTGFGFLGHLNEMVNENYAIQISSANVKFIPEAERIAREFLLTSAGQKNRNFLAGKIHFENVADYMQEILFDPQTSGGLLIAVSAEDTEPLFTELEKLPLASSIVGEVVPRVVSLRETRIFVR
jgi:selenide,water dikinase